METIFRTILYQPLLNALVILYDTVALRDLGLAIIFLTIAVRLLLYPIFYRTAQYQRISYKLQPEIQKIKERHRNNREAQTKAILELYQKHQLNPFAPFVLLLVQLPVLFALYLIFVSDFSAGVSAGLYSFIPHQGGLNHTFLGLLDLTQKSIPLAVLAAAAQYIQVRVGYAGSGSSAGSATARLMSLAVPVITLAVLFRFPAALGLYWLTTTIFSIIQQVVVNRTIKIKP